MNASEGSNGSGLINSEFLDLFSKNYRKDQSPSQNLSRIVQLWRMIKESISVKLPDKDRSVF